MKRTILWALTALLMCSCEVENSIVGTWTYDTPEWHGMTTHHALMFWENGDYQIVCEFYDRGQKDMAVEQGHYTYVCETLTLTDRVIVDTKRGTKIPIGADVQYHVVINNNQMLMQMGDYEPVIYRR